MGIAELWESLNQAITVYTGLSPPAFFTALALAGAVYFAVSSLFSRPEPVRNRELEIKQSEPLAPPVQLGEITEEELKVYDGSDPKKPLLMAIKGQIYDVSQSRMFYGPGGPYALFAGKDASRALAKMSFEEQDLTGDISGLGPFELEALQDWEYKFMSKYATVGTIKKTVVVTDASTTEIAAVSETTEIATASTENNSNNAAPVHEAEGEAKAEHCKHGEEGSDNGPTEHGVEGKEGSHADHSAETKEHVVSGNAAGTEGYDAETKNEPADHTAIPKEDFSEAKYVLVEDSKQE